MNCDGERGMATAPPPDTSYRACKLPLSFDPDRLRADLAAAGRHWIPHFVRRNYEGEWSAIPLRSLAGHPEHIFSDPGASVEAYRDTTVLDACPYFRAVLAAFHCPVASVRLLKLAPGSRIREHTDHDLTASKGMARLHVPVTTNPDVEFYIEDERIRMAEGECWYIDASLRHRLANGGATDRVHMVLDCVVDDWLQAGLAAAGYRARPVGFLEARGVRPQDLAKVIAALRAMGTDAGLAQARELESGPTGAAIGDRTPAPRSGGGIA